MNDFERFVPVLMERLKEDPPCIECSRVELMASEASQTVMVLLRTKPSLSAKMLDAAEFQYPALCLLNTMKIVASIIEYIERQIVLLSASELAQAAMAGAIASLKVDEETAMFTVPRVQLGAEALTSEWGRMLFASSHPLSGQGDVTGIDLHVVHLPDIPLEQLSLAEKLHLTRFSMGWNFARLFGEDHTQELRAVIEYASRNAQTILTY